MFRSMAVAVILSMCAAGLTSAQEWRREVVPAPEESPVTVLEDGTVVRKGDAVPDFILIQNFLLSAHVEAQTEARWSALLQQLEIAPESATADELRVVADRVWLLAQKIPADEGGSVPTPTEAYFRQVGQLWGGLEHSLKSQQSVANAIESYVDTTVRRSSKLITPADEAAEYSLQLTLFEAAFESGRAER